MADPGVSGLGSAMVVLREWGPDGEIRVWVAGTLRVSKGLWGQATRVYWFQGCDGGEDIEVGRGENSFKNSSCEEGREK